MKVLIVGSGGREHAIALAIASSPQKPALFFAPGNPGMSALGKNLEFKADDLDGICAFATENKLDLVVIGPEQPLVLGLADRLREAGISAFGPGKGAAAIEGSKAFSKGLMKKYGIPTAAYGSFTELDSALAYLRKKGAPIVVKASGLAAGKGAIVCMELEEAEDAVKEMMGADASFGDAGREVVIEEFMEGEEASLFAFCHGLRYELLSSAQDHKNIFEGDKGPNTGGMGAYAPAPVVTPGLLARVRAEIIEPTLRGMEEEGVPYTGVLYVGLMIRDGDARVVEYNCRLGDPEAQVVLPLYPGDALDLFVRAAEGDLSPRYEEDPEGHAAIVVLASRGYPGSCEKGFVIDGLDLLEVVDSHAIHAGTAEKAGKLVTAGGRVLGIVGHGDSLQQAVDRAYAGVTKVEFEGKTFRRDIAAKGLKR